ncbi:OmpA family protein [Antarctobacter jejuensis]|uniref:OmpA family protein n=1 Tax=Antarctobacter jejuensis TaxID=1439938 RepID=UPI003FD3B93F
MTKHFLIACAALCLPAMAAAQSTVTLDSFKLDPAPQVDNTPKADGAASEMRDCLLDQSACESAEFDAGASFTLDDVQNLGVAKRVAAAPPPNSGNSAALAIGPRPDPKPLPTIDLEVLFAYNSDALTPQAMAKLSSLSSALSDPQFQNRTLIFIGHTDAVGSAAYNNQLSLRRAQSVANYVRATMGLPSSQIEAVGVGFSKLKNTWDPASAQNRRVQLVVAPGS